MIDSHIHLSYKYYDQTFSYITMEADKYVIKSGNRESFAYSASTVSSFQ